MKVYISGRISGNEHYEEDFNWVESQLKSLIDIEPVNPIASDKIVKDINDWAEFMKKDIDFLKECDAILLIQGSYPLHKSSNWKNSYGAKIERLIAKKYKMKIFYGWRQFQSWYLKKHKYDINSEAK